MKPDEIKDLRKAKKLTQTELGDLCGVKNSSVSRWEKGVDKPSGAALKILKQLRDGDIVITELSDLESKLLEQNVKIGGFKNKEDYLTTSLKFLLQHGDFMSITHQQEEKITPLKVAEDESHYANTKSHIRAAAGSPVNCELIDWDGSTPTLNVEIYGLSMEPKFADGQVIQMTHKSAANSPFMKKGLIYLIRHNGGFMVKRYNTRPARPDEKEADYLTNTGTVGVLESINPKFPPIDITEPVDWEAWHDEKKK